MVYKNPYEDNVVGTISGSAKGKLNPEAVSIDRVMKNCSSRSLTLDTLSDKLAGILADLGIPRDKKTAVAVSGGSDSMALILALHRIMPVVALTVDHGLRDASAAEAQTVKSQLDDIGIEQTILNWIGEKPSANIQARAREERYRLMENWCLDNKIAYLMTGHQKDDLAESFLIRLIRGSGVDGLAAMPHTAPGLFHPDDITRVRPMLSFGRQELKEILAAEGVKYIEDPSNDDEQFGRVRARRFLESEQLPGLTVDRIAETAERLRWASDALREQTRDWFFRTVSLSPFGTMRLSLATFEQAPKDVGLRLLAELIMLVSGHSYKPRLSSLQKAYEALSKSDFSGQSLGGVLIEKGWGDGIFLIREARAMADNVPLEDGKIYDRRWRMVVQDPEAAKGITVGPLGDAGWRDLKVQDHFDRLNELRHRERLSLPALFRDGDCLGPAVLTGGSQDEIAKPNHLVLIPTFMK